MDWNNWLESAETLRWQGCPAPRCWTFRNWRHAAFGALVLLFSLWWLASGITLARQEGGVAALLLPIPAVVASAWLACGHLLVARLEWPRVGFAITDRRILATRGLLRVRCESLPLAAVSYYQVVPYSARLATIRVYAASLGRWCVLRCIEEPQQVTALLDAALAARGENAAPAGEIV